MRGGGIFGHGRLWRMTPKSNGGEQRLVGMVRIVRAAGRGCALLSIFLIVLHVLTPPAFADCGYNPCHLPCYCWTLITVNPITTCGYQCWYEERLYYCNTYPFGYYRCWGCFCYA